MLFIIKLLESKSVVQDPHLQSVTALTDFLLKKRHIYTSPQKVIFDLHSLIYKRLFLLTLYKVAPETPAQFPDNPAIQKFHFLSVH